MKVTGLKYIYKELDINFIIILDARRVFIKYSSTRRGARRIFRII